MGLSRRTPLEHTLLGLLARGPATAYELVSRLRMFPIEGRGQSKGAVYPALRRLADAGLIGSTEKRPLRGAAVYFRAGRRGDRGSRPPARLYLLTYDGREALRQWAEKPVTAADLLERPGLTLLRFTFVDDLVGWHASLRFLARYGEIAGEMATELRRILERDVEERSDTVRLTLELDAALMETRAAWAAHARRVLGAPVAPDPGCTTGARHEVTPSFRDDANRGESLCAGLTFSRPGCGFPTG